MAWEQDKFEAFWNFLFQLNPSLETVSGMIDALEKWAEYKKTMADSIELIMNDETREYLDFVRIMKKGMER